ncbi:hypothetical protein D9757_014475 [Collybiopsis confluens]|uniref:Uncharacterized protein n=1 Tax=Collybiopsis confluens TaxID=2823264 RepID=A0A8H5LMH0_9AGAR|nr:hypothetical protein D9757_014475 [Collybiopsis confluens]
MDSTELEELNIWVLANYAVAASAGVHGFSIQELDIEYQNFCSVVDCRFYCNPTYKDTDIVAEKTHRNIGPVYREPILFFTVPVHWAGSNHTGKQYRSEVPEIL